MPEGCAVAVLDAVEVGLPDLSAEPRLAGLAAWVLDCFPGRDPSLCARAATVRAELVKGLSRTRPEPRLNSHRKR